MKELIVAPLSTQTHSPLCVWTNQTSECSLLRHVKTVGVFLIYSLCLEGLDILSHLPFGTGVIWSKTLTLHSYFLKVRAKQADFLLRGTFMKHWQSIVHQRGRSVSVLTENMASHGLCKSSLCFCHWKSLLMITSPGGSFMWGTLWWIDTEPADHRQIQKKQHQKKLNQGRSKGSNPIKESGQLLSWFLFLLVYFCRSVFTTLRELIRFRSISPSS